MKNHARFSVFLLLTMICVCFVAGCKKDDDASLISTWEVTSATFNPAVTINGVVITDAYPYLFDSCQYDDLWVFEENGVFIQDEGPVKCDTAQFYTGSYSQSGSTLTIVTPSFTLNLGNADITEHELTGTVLFSIDGVIQVPVDFVLTRQ